MYERMIDRWTQSSRFLNGLLSASKSIDRPCTCPH